MVERLIMIKEFDKKILETILPFYYNFKAYKKIEEREQNILRTNYFDDKITKEFSDIVNQNNFETIKELYKLTIERKSKLEEKAKTLVISVTIAVPFSINGINIINKIENESIRNLCSVIFILAAFFMIIAGILSIKVFTEQIKLYTVDETKRELYFEYKKVTILNRLLNIIKNNYIYASYECLRNSLLLVIIFCIIVILFGNTSFSIIPLIILLFDK